MHVNFYYKNTALSDKRERIITQFANAVSQVIELPNSIDVCLYMFDKNVYGGIDKNHINRIGINYNLPYDSIPMILTHELIHVNQKYTGLLRIAINGTCYWREIPYSNTLPQDISYTDYQNLPWEKDVEQRQVHVFGSALDIIRHGFADK